MSCQDKPHDSNSSNEEPDAPARVAQATRAGEPRQRPFLNLTGGHFSANTHGLTSHYLPQGMSGPSRFMISENNGSKFPGED